MTIRVITDNLIYNQICMRGESNHFEILHVYEFYALTMEETEMPEDVFKMPRMGKAEYDRLVEEQYVCRIAFKGETHPYIAPFIYVFDGRFMYFLIHQLRQKGAVLPG